MSANSVHRAASCADLTICDTLRGVCHRGSWPSPLWSEIVTAFPETQ